MDLGAQRGWMDFDVAAKLTGSRFVVLSGLHLDSVGLAPRAAS